jgi:RecB family endonuclease NucS
MELSRIQQVPLREIWKHEASNFTKWLAMDENLALLSEEINIELTVIETEYNVGRFHVDIYAHEANTNRKVIIENQLEKTDHDHLGKLITYASGVDAEIIIWIVKEGL